MQPEFWVIAADNQEEVEQALDDLKRNTLSKYTRIEQLTTSISHGTTASTHNTEVTDLTTFTYSSNILVIVSAMVEE